MAGVSDINTIWRNIREIDLQGFREHSLREVRLVMVGASGSGRHKLADNLRRDPSRPQQYTQSPILILDLNEASQPFSADLIIVMADSRQPDITAEMALTSHWSNQGKKVIVFINQTEPASAAEKSLTWSGSRVISGSVEDVKLLHGAFASLVMELLSDRLLGLGRQFPLFRVPIAHALINETCFSNATYALGTGLAGVVAVLNLPLTVTDMIVLTKSQAFLVYKLGLVFGFSLEWRDYLAEFGSVIGSGFMWRQLARSLVGLIPVLGIVPKIAVAYSGTFVVGHTVLQWYLTGKHLSAQQMRALTVQAFRRGQDTARRLVAKVHRPRLKGEKKKARKAKQISGDKAQSSPELGPGEQQVPVDTAKAKPPKKGSGVKKIKQPGKTESTAESASRKPRRLFPKKKAETAVQESKVCPQCGKSNALDANFCQYCAAPFSNLALPQPDE